MGKREQLTVNEFRDVNDPEKVLITHTSDTGEEPFYVNSETLVGETRIENGQVQHRDVAHRLEDLVRDYYMFSLAPIYLVCLWDREAGKIKFDLLYRFAVEMKMLAVPPVIHYTSPFLLFNSGSGLWDSFLQGLPNDGNLPYLFPRWVEQLVFVDRNVRPMTYWRVNRKKIHVRTAGVAATPAEVEVFLPTGVDRRLDIQERADGTFEYVQCPPEDWVTEEAMRYFGGIQI